VLTDIFNSKRPAELTPYLNIQIPAISLLNPSAGSIQGCPLIPNAVEHASVCPGESVLYEVSTFSNTSDSSKQGLIAFSNFAFIIRRT